MRGFYCLLATRYSLLASSPPRLILATNLPLTSFGVCLNATLRNKLPAGLMEPSLNHLMAYSLTRPSALVRPDYEFWTQIRQHRSFRHDHFLQRARHSHRRRFDSSACNCGLLEKPQ